MNNSLDKGAFLVGGGFTIFLYIAMIYTTYGLDFSMMASLIPTFTFGVICFVLYLGIQKKVHKDAFLEIMEKVSSRQEFQTIFNELDESVVILNSSNRIVQLNQMYHKFLFKIFGESISSKVKEYTALFETLENEKLDEIRHNKRSKAEKCCSYICCWRPNKKERVNLSENETRKFQHAENEVLT